MKVVTGWDSPNTDASNSSGFNGLAAGIRNGDGTFINLGKQLVLWSNLQSLSDVSHAYDGYLSYDNASATIGEKEKTAGFSIRCIKNEPVVDIDGNSYKTVTIGTQTWTQSNLNVSKYTDGTAIPQVTDPTAWAALTTGAWCYYANDTANGPVYGKLYNWYAVAGIYDAASLADATLRKKLAPAGYHVPSDAEWTTLTTFLGGESVAGNQLKATTGWTPYSGITNTNSSGFTGLPGGYRSNDGTISGNGIYGYWWSSSEFSATFAWYRVLFNSTGNANRSYDDKAQGFSVRCLKD